MSFLDIYFQKKSGSYLELKIIKYYNRKLYLRELIKHGKDELRLNKDIELITEILDSRNRKNKSLSGYVSLGDLALCISRGMKISVLEYDTDNDLTWLVFLEILKGAFFGVQSKLDIYNIYMKE